MAMPESPWSILRNSLSRLAYSSFKLLLFLLMLTFIGFGLDHFTYLNLGASVKVWTNLVCCDDVSFIDQNLTQFLVAISTGIAAEHDQDHRI